MLATWPLETGIPEIRVEKPSDRIATIVMKDIEISRVNMKRAANTAANRAFL